MERRNVGIGLLVAALVLLLAAFVLWEQGTKDAEADQLAEEYRAAILSEAPDEVEPTRTGPIVLCAFAAVAAIAGTIVLVSPSSDS